jgi:DNA-binding transcriptional MerR regulator
VDDARGTAPLRTADVARAAGCSVQQVRDLERLGVIPPAGRAANGYRTFGAEHVVALQAYRGLAAAVGPVEARRTLREVRGSSPEEAAARVSALHVRLATEREEVLAALRALRSIRAEAHDDAAGAPAPATADDVLTIGELAGALGVRASTLRFWEDEGLVRPERVTSLAVRRYPPAAVREARIVAALRAAGYRVADVRRTVDALRRLDGLDEPRDALRGRLDAIARRTLALLRAGADVARLVETGTPADPTAHAGAAGAEN